MSDISLQHAEANNNEVAKPDDLEALKGLPIPHLSVIESLHRLMDHAEPRHEDDVRITALLMHLKLFRILPESLRTELKSKLMLEELGIYSKSESPQTLVYRQGSLISKNPRLWVILDGHISLCNARNNSVMSHRVGEDGSNSPISVISSPVHHYNDMLSPEQKIRRTLKSTAITISVINATRHQVNRRHPPDVTSLRSKNISKAKQYDELSENAVLRLGDAVVVLKAGDSFGEEVLGLNCTERRHSAVAHGIVTLLAIEDKASLQALRNFLLSQTSPTFVLRPEWCREPLRHNAARGTTAGRVRIAHLLDGLRIFDSSKHAGNIDYVVDNIGYCEVDAHEVIAQEEQGIDTVQILLSGKVELRKKGAYSMNGKATDLDTHALGGVVGTAECSGDILTVPAPWFHGRHDCSIISTALCEVILLPQEIFKIFLSRGGRCRVQSSNFTSLLYKQPRTMFDNRRLASLLQYFHVMSDLPVTSHVQIAGKFQVSTLAQGHIVDTLASDPKGVRILVHGHLWSDGSMDGVEGDLNRSEDALSAANILDPSDFWLRDLSRQSLAVSIVHEAASIDTLDGFSLFSMEVVEACVSGVELELFNQQLQPSLAHTLSAGAEFGTSDLVKHEAPEGIFVVVKQTVIGLVLDSDLRSCEIMRISPFGISYFDRIRQAAAVPPADRHPEDIALLLPALSDSVYSQLPISILQDICIDAEFRSVREGDFVCVEGQEARCLFFVLNGSLSAKKSTERLTLATYGPGTTFGHACLIPRRAYRYSVQAREYAELLVVHQDKVREYLTLPSDVYVDLGQCRRTLQVPSEMRVDEDEMVVERAMANVPSLNVNKQILSQVCKRLKYKEVEAGEIVCLEGEFAIANYFVISGSVSQYSGLLHVMRKKLRLCSGQHYNAAACRERIEGRGVKDCEGNLLRVKSGPYSEQWSAAKTYRIDGTGNMGVVTPGSPPVVQTLGNLRYDVVSCELRNAEAAGLRPGSANSPEKPAPHHSKMGKKSSAASNADNAAINKKGPNLMAVAYVSSFASAARKIRRRASDGAAAGAHLGGSLDDSALNDGAHDCHFSITFSSGKTWDFQAPSEKDFDLWTDCISYHILQGQQEPLGKLIRELSAGAELHAMQPPNGSPGPEKTRQTSYASSMVAKSRTELMMIYSSDWDAAEREYHDSNRQEARRLLRSLDLSIFPSDVLRQLAASMRPKLFLKGDEMFRAGDKCTELVFLADGECAIKMRSSQQTVEVRAGQGGTVAKEKHGAVHVATLRAPSMLALYTSVPLEASRRADDVTHTVTAVACTDAHTFVLRLEDFRRIEEESRLPLMERLMARLGPVAAAQRAQLAQLTQSMSKALFNAGHGAVALPHARPPPREPVLDPNAVFFGEVGFRSLILSRDGGPRPGSDGPDPAPRRRGGEPVRSEATSPSVSRAGSTRRLLADPPPPASFGAPPPVPRTPDRSAAVEFFEAMLFTGTGASKKPALSLSDRFDPSRSVRPGRLSESRGGGLARSRGGARGPGDPGAGLPDAEHASMVRMEGFHRLRPPRDVLRAGPPRLFKRTADTPLWGRCALLPPARRPGTAPLPAQLLDALDSPFDASFG